MKKCRSFISEIDILILKKLMGSKKESINTGELTNLVNKQHKILKPHIKNLEDKGFIKRKSIGATKFIEIIKNPENLAFINRLVFLFDKGSL